MPAIVAMMISPIAQRETDSVTRSHTPSHRASSPGISTLPSDRLRFAMSLSRKRQMKRIVNAARKSEKNPPAIPRTAEIALGTSCETCWAPSWTFPAAPESPSHESSSESCSCWTVAGSSWRKSRTEPTSGTSRSSARAVTATAVPRTVTVAASPRDMCVFAITNRTGNSNTRARKIPTKTIRNVSPIAANAAPMPMAAATTRIVRIGRTSSTRFEPDGSIGGTLRRRSPRCTVACDDVGFRR